MVLRQIHSVLVSGGLDSRHFEWSAAEGRRKELEAERKRADQRGLLSPITVVQSYALEIDGMLFALQQISVNG